MVNATVVDAMASPPIADPTSARPTTPPPVVRQTTWAVPRRQAPESGGDGDGWALGDAALADDGVEAFDKDSGAGLAASCLSAAKDRHRFDDILLQLDSSAPIIDGIEVGLEARTDDAIGQVYFCVQLSWDGGQTWTEPERTNQLTAEPAFLTAGLPDDTWGRTWSAGELDNGRLAVRVISVSDDTRRDLWIDWIGVRASYH
ncbi:MAG: hypothetical protein HY873_11070 [Chloroflexi bacterium]|nr:hypothetical protein [Chloroflexota bacterium]